MAGTTVRDDGLVTTAFLAALEHIGISRDDPAVPGHLDYVQATMGQSKIVVFRGLLGDEERAQVATAAFEAAVADAIRAGGIEPIAGAEDAFESMRSADIAICLTTGFSAATQALIIETLGWRDLVDLTLAPGADGGPPLPRPGAERADAVGDRRRALLGRRRRHRQRPAGRVAPGAGIVAGVLTGAHDRATLEAAPHTHVLDSIADLPAVLPRGPSPTRTGVCFAHPGDQNHHRFGWSGVGVVGQ